MKTLSGSASPKIVVQKVFQYSRVLPQWRNISLLNCRHQVCNVAEAALQASSKNLENSQNSNSFGEHKWTATYIFM